MEKLINDLYYWFIIKKNASKFIIKMIYNNIIELKHDLPDEGRIMALDVGTKTIGVAISDLSRTISTPKLTIKRKSNKSDFLILEKIIKENSIQAIVIGMPLNMDNSESAMSTFTRRFSENLDQFLQIQKIIFADERLSTFAADEFISEFKMKKDRSKSVDQIAASIVLQAVLDELKQML